MNKAQRNQFLKQSLRNGIECFDIITYQTGIGCGTEHFEYQSYRHGMKGYHEVLMRRINRFGTPKDYCKHDNNTHDIR